MKRDNSLLFGSVCLVIAVLAAAYRQQPNPQPVAAQEVAEPVYCRLDGFAYSQVIVSGNFADKTRAKRITVGALEDNCAAVDPKAKPIYLTVDWTRESLYLPETPVPVIRVSIEYTSETLALGTEDSTEDVNGLRDLLDNLVVEEIIDQYQDQRRQKR